GLGARLDEAGGVMLAAVLVGKGLDPGLTVAFLAVGAATRGRLIRGIFDGRRPRAIALLAGCVAAVAAGKLLATAGALATSQAAAAGVLRDAVSAVPEQVAASPLRAAAAAVLVLLALATLWSEGVRGWFAPLRHGPGAV
ncbi:MAG TPA: hypothetical protein VFE90_05155, partial [Myxococcales bacterium]|nr:hypothetical protein [Myxococcales bacterium]